jgi:hypothetical protein
VSTPLAQPATKTFEETSNLAIEIGLKKYMFKRNPVGRALLLPSRVSKVEFQSFVLKTGVARAIENICETTLYYSKIRRIMDNKKERCITGQRIGCELDDQEIGL